MTLGSDAGRSARSVSSAAPLVGFKVFADPLIQNGLALVLSAALSAMLGFAFWVLAARLFPPPVVGVSSVMINSMITIASLAQLNLGNFLTRSLAGSGSSAKRIILISYLLVIVSGTAFGTGFIFLSRVIAPELSLAFSSLQLSVGYVFCIVIWTIFGLQDCVLAGLRKSIWVPVENGVFALAKIALLVLFAGWQNGPFGPFLAWIAPALLLIPAANLLIVLRVLPATSGTPARPPLKVGQIAGMMSWDYAATLAMMFGLASAPILVLEYGGADAAAEYSVAWAITYSIYLVARSMGVSMLAEAAAEPSQRMVFAARSLALTFGLLAIAVAGVVILAPYVLLIFGQHYAGENVKLLRLLALSTVPWGFTTIYIAIARSAGLTGRIAAIQIITVAVFFAAAAACVNSMGITGVGFAWLVAQCLVLVGIVLAEFRSQRERLLEFLLRTGVVMSSLFTSLQARRRAWNAELDDREAAVVTSMFEQPVGSLAVDRVTTFDNDCETLRITAADSGHEVYLKRATGQRGREALDRHTVNVMRLQADLAGTKEYSLLPDLLASEHGARGDFIVQKSVPGSSGRLLLLPSLDPRSLLIQAADAMASIHAAACHEVLIGSDWIDRWVDRPLAKIAMLPDLWLTADRKSAALALIRKDQHSFWTGRRIMLGWHHGDFSPGNIFYDKQPEVDSRYYVSGIIDWEGAVNDGPAIIDAWHLALTAERERRSDEFGFVMRGLILNQGPAFMFRPDIHLVNASSTGPATILATLAWLRHIDGNLSKSTRYEKNPLWRFNNIELVLESYLTMAGPGLSL